ncbi:hypothetical protein BH09PSE2_BH09PSE2_04970 [soil metagenome]
MNVKLTTSAVMTGLLGSLVLAGSAAAQTPAGSYQQSCRNAQTSNGVLSAQCADRSGAYRNTSLSYGQCRSEISNNNGSLVCTIASAAPVAASATQARGAGRSDFRQNQERDGYGASRDPGRGAYGRDDRPGLGGERRDAGRDPGFGRGADGGWDPRDHGRVWDGAPPSAFQRIDWLRRRIRQAGLDGRIDRDQSRRAFAELRSIEDQARSFSRRGRELDGRQQAILQNRLDRLTGGLRWMQRDNRR